jgi:hypothetical protein
MAAIREADGHFIVICRTAALVEKSAESEIELQSKYKQGKDRIISLVAYCIPEWRLAQ